MIGDDRTDRWEDPNLPVELDDVDSLAAEAELEGQSAPRRRPGRPRGVLFSDPRGWNTAVVRRARRDRFLGTFRNWEQDRPDLLDWNTRRRQGDPDWQYRRTAQFSLILIGRYPDGTASLDTEAILFLVWLRENLAQSERNRRGPKRDIDTTWRTALALAVARSCAMGTQPNRRSVSRHYTQPPTDREIAETWYFLFGEERSRDSIRPKLRPIATLCKKFAMNRLAPEYGPDTHFRKAADAILKFGPKPGAKWGFLGEIICSTRRNM